jgi:hypothetical protein
MPTVNKIWEQRLGSTRTSAGRTGQIAVVVLASLAGLHVVWDFLFSTPPDFVGPARSVVNESALVSSYAQDFVGVWLTATSTNAGSITEFVTVKSTDLKLPSTPAVVIDAPSVVSVTYTGPAGNDASTGVYSVVVGVTQRSYESAPPDRALYRVPVLYSKYGLRAINLPARIGNSGLGADATMGYAGSVAPKDPLFAVVSGFLNAYLTKAGGLDRYVTARSRLVALGDVYQSATVTSLLTTAAPAGPPNDGDVVRVLARVIAINSQYAPSELAYPLTLTGVGGRWTVAAIDHAPVMAAEPRLAPIVTASASK